MNAISNMKTVTLQSTDGPVFAILIGLDIPDLDTAPAFVGEVAEQFKLQRMSSPPETSGMLVTLIGAMSSEAFAQCWNELAANDNILGFFMSEMKIAEAVRGTETGERLDSISLIAQAA